MSNEQPKWTEIEHLPEWDEDFYEVYTAKKHGKWVMLKTLRPELRDKPEYREMIEKEFDVRYNLAHPSIIMINDFEEVPGLGMCIITDAKTPRQRGGRCRYTGKNRYTACRCHKLYTDEPYSAPPHTPRNGHIHRKHTEP